MSACKCKDDGEMENVVVLLNVVRVTIGAFMSRDGLYGFK